MHILKSLVKRKFSLIIADWNNLTLEQLAAKINEDLHKFKAKRLEENYKLVFKRGLKFMLNNFKVKRHLKLKKNQTERLFVEHFFGDADLCLGTKARKRGEFCLFNPKTINARYI